MVQESRAETFYQRTTQAIQTAQPKIIFVGSAVHFSDRLLSAYRAEFGGFEFIRIPNIHDAAVARRIHDEISLVVFEADQMQSALDNPRPFSDAAGKARIAFALSDPLDAAQFLISRQNEPIFENVGFLPLNAPMDVWISVMQLFLCDQNFIPQEVACALIDRSVQTEAAQIDNTQLTKREWEVLGMVAKGAQNKIIADDLGLSVHTVKLHLHNLLKKIGVSNRTCAASWYMQNGNGQTQ